MKKEDEKKTLIPRSERKAIFEARKEKLMRRFFQAENLSVEIIAATKEKPQETETILQIGRYVREHQEELVKREINEMRGALMRLGILAKWEQEFIDCLASAAKKYPDLMKNKKEWLSELDIVVKNEHCLEGTTLMLTGAVLTVREELAENVKRRMKQAVEVDARKKLAANVGKAVVTELRSRTESL